MIKDRDHMIERLKHENNILGEHLNNTNEGNRQILAENKNMRKEFEALKTNLKIKKEFNEKLTKFYMIMQRIDKKLKN